MQKIYQVKLGLILSLVFYNINLTFSVEKIYVTAEKVKRNKNYSSSSIILITQDDIRKLKPKNLEELLINYAGIDIVKNGIEGSISQVYIRGADARHTKIIINGFEFNNSTSVGGAPRFEMLDINSIEKVEILKGSQGVIYGSDAIAGVISITTKKGVTYLESSFGSNNRKNIVGSVSTINNDWIISSNINYIDSNFKSAYYLGTEKDGFSRYNISLQMDRKVGNSKTSFLITHISSKVEFDNISGDSGDYEKYLKDMFGASHKFLLKDGLWESKIKAVYQTIESQYFPSDNLFKGDSLKISSENTLFISSNSTFLFGLDYQNNDASDLGSKLTKNVTQRNVDLYFDFFHKDSFYFTSTGVRASKYESQKVEASSKIAVGKKFEYFILKSALNTGFKMPSLYQFKGPFGNFDLKPERSVSYDLSITFPFPKETIEVDLYFLSYTDFIDFKSNRYQNISKVSSKGLDVNAKIKRWKNFYFTYSFQYNVIKDKLTNKELVNRSKIKDTLYFVYEIGELMNIGFGLLYKSKRLQIDDTYQPGYTIYNLKFNYDASDKSNFFLQVNNLLNLQYQDVKNYSSEGISYNLGYRYRF